MASTALIEQIAGGLSDDELVKQMNQMQQQARDAAMARAEEARREAEEAAAIARRDEREVAGKDVERAATEAARLAKQELGHAAGGGAAAVAGASAAQETRDKMYTELLQRARDRRDLFEQRAVDRRMMSYRLFANAQEAEMLRIKDQQIREFIQRLLKDREDLQIEALLRGRGGVNINIGDTGGGRTTTPPPRTVPGTAAELRELDREISGPTETETQRMERERGRRFEELGQTFNIPDKYPTTITIPRLGTIDKNLDPLSYARNYRAWVHYIRSVTPGTSREIDAIRRQLDAGTIPEEPPEIPEHLQSDERLKIYDEQGNNTGVIGDAERSEDLATKKAERLFEKKGLGINDMLVQRFGRG